MTEVINIACKTPANVADTLSKTICVQKTTASDFKLTILGILAGVYIGFGAAISTLVASDATKIFGLGIGRALSGAVFSVGLMLVVVAGAELFTGNNLMLMGVLNKRVRLGKVLYKWVVVYFANFAGSLFLVWLMYKSGLWKSQDFATGISALKIANTKVGLTWSEVFYRAIGCNVLVCLAVWMALASQDIIGRIWAIFFPIMTFVALGFEHCIANMYFIPIGILLKGTEAASQASLNLTNLTWNGFIFKNLIPATIGNIIGGSLFVGMLYWFVYVRAEKTA